MYVPDLCTKYAVSCFLFIILLAFDEHIHLVPKKYLAHLLKFKAAFRHLLCFNSRREDLIRVYPSSKKNLIHDWENVIAY